MVGTFLDGSSADVTKSSRITYNTSNAAVATVTGDGVVTGTAPGTANITLAYNDVSTTLTVSVPNSVRGDLDGDGDVDQDDLNIVLACLNMSAVQPKDARDLNGDGVIDDRNVAILKSLCSRPGCATFSNRIAPTITWPKPADISFGTAIGNAQLNATASIPEHSCIHRRRGQSCQL